MCVCKCICVCKLCMCVCAPVWLCARTCVCTRVSFYAGTHARQHMHTDTSTHTHTKTLAHAHALWRTHTWKKYHLSWLVERARAPSRSLRAGWGAICGHFPLFQLLPGEWILLPATAVSAANLMWYIFRLMTHRVSTWHILICGKKVILKHLQSKVYIDP